MALPIKGGKIGTPFGVKGKMWSSGSHQGCDFPVPVGTPVLAVADGVVIKVPAWGSAFGKHQPLIKHVVGGKTYYCLYAHVSKVLVKAGDHVKKGQHIADSGAEGNVTGPHLHFEAQLGEGWVRTGGVDPKPLFDA